MKLIEIYKKKREIHEKLFNGDYELQNVECMDDYMNRLGISQIDKVIIRKFGSREFDSIDYDEERIIDEWTDAVEGYIIANAYNLDKVWEMLHEEYDPLYNYDKTSDITNTHAGDILIKTGGEKEEYTKSGSETNTNTKSGSETNTNTKSGTETHTDTKSGSETNTNTKSGSETHAKDNGIRDSKTTNKNNAWDNTNSYTVSESETIDQPTTDSDKLTFANRQDTDVLTFANRQDTDVLTFANRKDTKDTTFTDRKDSINYSDTIHEVTKGNIGTTTSSDLMIKEFDARWKVNFYMELFTNLIYDLTW